MTCRRLRDAARLSMGTVCVRVLLVTACAAAGEPTVEQSRFFEARVRPVLVEQCVKCHGPATAKAHLRLDTLSGALVGGDQGPAVVPGKPEESLLVKAVRHDDDQLKMPPSRKLPSGIAADLARWVAMGAPWPGPGGGAEPREPGSAATSSAGRGPLTVTDKDRAHWAFQPVRRPVVPVVRDRGWVRNPIDAFILAGLESRRLATPPAAERSALIRRVSYDLTGLPPTPAEVDAYLADTRPDAYERLVDRLLASPHFGEKWARHWLDLVRFAETNSYERDDPKPSAWRYRDYIIRAFNDDKPYDRFVHEQLAGDELPDGGLDGIVATGYYRLGIWDDEPTDREQARYDGLDDVLATTGQVFLGITVDCARCHDHKIDPIPQADYYRLLAFFHNVNHYRNGGPTDESPAVAGAADETARAAHERVRKDQRDGLQSKIGVIEAELRSNATQAGVANVGTDIRGLIRTRGLELLGKDRLKEYQELHRALRDLDRAAATGPTVLRVTEAGAVAPDTFVLLRGNPHVRGEKVAPGFLTVLGAPAPVLPHRDPGALTTGRRTVLAHWITAPSNPLTARVIANRLWQHHFGRGIVRSPSNFGTQGDRPTHPELLDWLATELVAGGWRLKPLHRLIVTSSAYRMASRGNPTALARDPANDAFWRFDMRRLTAEEVRDSVLAVSGTLNPAMYGPGVYPEIPPEVLAGQSQPGKGWGKSSPAEQLRRSIYVHVKRSLLLPVIEGFDMAETDRSSPSRFSTTQPTQALAMLNGKFLNDQAAALADRLQREAGANAKAQVGLALRLTTSRTPADDEIARGVALVESLSKTDGMPRAEALRAFCLVMLNLNEFLYLD